MELASTGRWHGLSIRALNTYVLYIFIYRTPEYIYTSGGIYIYIYIYSQRLTPHNTHAPLATSPHTTPVITLSHTSPISLFWQTWLKFVPYYHFFLNVTNYVPATLYARACHTTAHNSAQQHIHTHIHTHTHILCELVIYFFFFLTFKVLQ